MSRKKTSFYINYPTSVVDGKKIVGSLIKEPIADDTGYITGYRDKISIERSPVDTSLSKDSAKYKQKIVKEYNPDILDTRSRVHSKKYGSKYTIVLDHSEIFIELAQIGRRYDQVRLIRLGVSDCNSCFIPDTYVRFENKLISFYLLCEYIGVTPRTLLDQCKAIALHYTYNDDQNSGNDYQKKRKNLVKKTQIR